MRVREGIYRMISRSQQAPSSHSESILSAVASEPLFDRVSQLAVFRRTKFIVLPHIFLHSWCEGHIAVISKSWTIAVTACILVWFRRRIFPPPTKAVGSRWQRKANDGRSWGSLVGSRGIQEIWLASIWIGWCGWFLCARESRGSKGASEPCFCFQYGVVESRTWRRSTT